MVNKNKTQPTTMSVADYIAALPDPARREEAHVVADLMEKISGHPATMWGTIIGFDTYHYVYDSGREGDMPAISFSPRAANLTIYLADSAELYAPILANLGPHKTAKVCLYIKHLKDVDIAVLESVIKASYQHIQAKKTNDSSNK